MRDDALPDLLDSGDDQQFLGRLSRGRLTARIGVIKRIESLPIDRLNPLVTEAAATGFQGLVRLVDEWRCRRNRFDQPGEAIFIAVDHGQVVGVCGLNRDLYLADPLVGRVRHLYVAFNYRRRGIGSQLVGVVVGAARDHFTRLRLRTESPGADASYRSLGFMRVTGEPTCSHEIVFTQEGQP
jgi:GNAT superfamily N-acetyltransferase